MSKKIVAMLMAVAMAFSLLPVTAFATGGTNGQAPVTKTASGNNLTMNKTVTPNEDEDGTYTVHLESYATGSVTPTQTPVPMDIVLVLDVSGSMKNNIAYYTYQATSKTSWSVSDVYNDYYDRGGWHRTDVTYYAKIGEGYYPVSYQSKWVWGYREHWLEANNQVLGQKVTDSTWDEPVYNEALYIRQTDSEKTIPKLDAMKTAVNHFIDSVAAQKNGNTPVAHRISIVKFAGTSTNEVGNYTYGDGKNYTQKVTELKDVTAEGSVASLKKAVNDLTAGGATAADWGMQKANDVLTKRENKEKPSIVIMFTDGEPNHGSGYKARVAGDTVQAAKALKDSGTKVYTIGMFKDLQSSNADKVDTYMNGVSSNYPHADSASNDSGVTLNQRAEEGDYYFKVDNADELDQVFQTISQSTTTTSPLDASAVVVDNVPSNFALTEGSVKVYTADCTAKSGEKFTWGTDTQAPEYRTNSTENEDGSQTISTTGFNFSGNWCGLDSNNKATGKKLIIEFTIKCTNYGGTQPTNAGAYIKANAGSTDRIIWVDDPEVPVTVQLPKVNNPADKTKDYKGAGYDITNEISEIIAGLVPVDGIKNQFIDLTYEIKDSNGNTVGTYTIPAGRTTGAWSADSTEIKTGSDVGTYNYTITVTGQDKKQPSNKNSKTCEATFTITQKEVTFTGESDSLTWNGKEQTITGITAPTDLVPGHTYEGGLTYVAKGTNTGSYGGKFTGTAIIKDADGNNVTANYNVKTEPGTLTITKDTNQTTVQITGNHDTVTYDGKEHQVSEYTTDIGNRDISVALKDGKVAKAEGTNVGEYKMGLTAADFTATSSSYDNIQITVEDGYLKIQPKSISPDQEGTPEDQKTGIVVTNPVDSKYDGKEHKNQIEVKDTKTGKTLTKDTDYTLQYSDDVINAGKVTITVKGIGNYTGEFSRDYRITPRDVTLTSATDRKPYDGTPLANNTVTVGGDGFAQGEGATYNVTGTQTEPNESSPTSNTFTYTLNEGTLAGNYNIRKVEGTLTVTGVTVDLSKLIQKELTLKEESSLPQDTTFKVTVTEAKDGATPIVGETASTSSWTGDGPTYKVPFAFANGLTLQKGENYSYQVTEDKNNPVSGVEYDSTTYQLTIKVEMNGTYSASYTVAPTGDATEATTTDVTEETPLTIKNTYQTPNLTVEKKPYKVNDTLFDANKTVAHVNDQIIWKVNVTNNKTTQASTQLTETLAGAAVYSKEDFTDANKVSDANGTWTAMVPANKTVTYYVTYTVKADDIPKGEIVNTIVMKNGDKKNSDPVSTWDTKQLKSAISLNSDWTTTVTLELPTVSKTEQQPVPIAVKSGSYVIDQIGNEFTFMDGLSLKVNNKELSVTKDETNKNLYHFRTETGGTDLYTVTYTDKNDETKTPAQFKWEINQDIPAGTEVTLSYKLELTTREKNPGTYGVEDLNGDNKTEPGKTPIYTNEKAALYIKEKENNQEKEIAVFPKPSVSYTISSGSSGSHSGGSRPSLNTKDHYGYIIGYPVDYYTGQPTTDQTKKPVRPEGKITRAEVATIYFRMLTDESRTKFWSQSNAYSDVKAGDWFNNAVSTLSNAGIIAGYEDGSFRPNGYITRAEFATIAARFFDVTYNGKDLFPDISGHWAKDYINQAANKGFVNGYEDGTFKPDRNITRAEAVTLVNRTLDRHPDKSHFTKDMLVWPDNMDQTKWYYADMQEATNSHTYQMKENSDKTKYENWTKTLPIRNWEALEKAWSNANSSQGNGNVV